MLWLCLHLPHLPLSALGVETAHGAVVDQRGSQRWLITDAPHSPAGSALAQALSLHPDLKLQVRRPASEQAALRSLAYWAYRYGQPVCFEIQDLSEPGRVPRALLWVEVGRSLALFGDLDALRDHFCCELLELGHAAQLGIAPTRAAAALRACAGQTDALLKIEQLRTAIGELPIALLHWPGELLRALHGVGFRHLHDLFAVPREAFSKRFGVQYRLALDHLLGDAPEPCEAIEPPERFHRRFELSAEVEEVERLQFPLKRLCTELQAYLRARDCGLCSVTLAVAHANARETRIHAQFVDPHRDAQRIFDALRERLERDGLPLPARELALMAEDFTEAAVPQSDLFDARTAQAQAWAAAIERIRARLGDTQVWMPQAVEDHRPEYSSVGRAEPTTAAGINETAGTARPTFLLTAPWPMPAPVLAHDAVFERIESGWWDEHDVRRDYITLDINGGRAWVFRELSTQAWYLHGWWS